MTFFTITEPVYNFQIGFQTPVTPIAEGIFAFHDDLIIFLTGILFFVRYIIYACLTQFLKQEKINKQTTRPIYVGKNHIPHHFVHAPFLEII